MRRTRRAAGTVAVIAISALTVLAAPAYASACDGSYKVVAGPVVAEAGWAQRWLGLGRVHVVQMGAGVRVAVVDSGVDRVHPQLSGAVGDGWEVPPDAAGNAPDCSRQGRGTAIASLIVARPMAGAGLVGVAPAATIVPVQVAGANGTDATPKTVAAGIRAATDREVRVVHVSDAFTVDDPDLRSAVEEAVRRDVVVVAAAGDGMAGVSYPAGYDGVIGVGAVTENGVMANNSSAGRHVDLTAPDTGVAAWRAGGHTEISSTAVAAAYVTGTVVLLRAAHPEWTAARVIRQLVGTADSGPGGVRSDQHGYGFVNPYRALTEPVANPRAEPTWGSVPDDVMNVPATPGWSPMWRRAVVWAAALLLVAGLISVVGASLGNRGRGGAPRGQ